jgi:hypothetical protein
MVRMLSTSGVPDAWQEALREVAAEAGGVTVEVAGPASMNLAENTVDTVIVTSPLDAMQDPLILLRAVRRALRPTGTLVCAVTNFARQETLVQLLRSDPQRAPGGVVQPDAVHVHGYATAFKELLEAGYSPDIASVIRTEDEPGLLEAARGLLNYVRVSPERAAKHLFVEHYIFVARPIADLHEAEVDERPISFVACVNDEGQLKHNLLASPVFRPGTPHELRLYRGMDSAAQGLNRGIREAEHDLVVLVQQDIYLPSWWPARLVEQWGAASAGDTPAIAGPFGVRYREGGRTHVGHAIDRDHLLRSPHFLPADVDGLDELLMVVPQDTPLRFDPRLGWHLYGTDYVLQAHAVGLRAVVLDIPCHHNSLYADLDDAYHHSESVLADKWPRELPILTNSSTIDQDPRDTRMAALESQLLEARQFIEDVLSRAETAERAVAERDAAIRDRDAALRKVDAALRRRTATLRRMRQSRSWRWGRRLARLTGRQ